MEIEKTSDHNSWNPLNSILVRKVIDFGVGFDPPPCNICILLEIVTTNQDVLLFKF